MNEWIWFDMDGTIADLYGVDNWLEDLLNSNERPYEIAKPIYDMDRINAMIETLKNCGYKVGVISWLCRGGSDEYNQKVIKAKTNWLHNYGTLGLLDKVLITKHGLCKADTCRKYGKGILVDDEANNRNMWDLGETINAENDILEEIATLM